MKIELVDSQLPLLHWAPQDVWARSCWVEYWCSLWMLVTIITAVYLNRGIKLKVGLSTIFRKQTCKLPWMNTSSNMPREQTDSSETVCHCIAPLVWATHSGGGPEANEWICWCRQGMEWGHWKHSNFVANIEIQPQNENGDFGETWSTAECVV